MNPLLSLVLHAITHPAAQTLGWTLIHFLWQGTALGLLAWLALVLLRRASARARYGMACAFLVLMVLAPVTTFLTLQRQVPTPKAALTLSVEAVAAAPSAGPAPLAQRVKATLDPALPWLLAGWGLGVLLLSTRFLGSWLRVQRLRRRSATPVPTEWHLVLSRLCRELKLSRTVRLLQSAAVEVPTALGWLRPMILLPACALAGLAPLQLEAILAHELAHIRRGDFLVNLLQSLVEVLLFYHPAVWWLSARIRSERELCCDDVAAELCGDPLILARALTDLEALRESDTPSSTHLALAANGGSLMNRVRHLLHPALPITSGARATALAVLAASLLGAAGVALQDPGKEAAAKPEKNTRITTADDKRKLDIRMKGDVKLNGEAPEPVTVGGDGSFRVEEKKGGKARAFAATKDKATYTVDGKDTALDKEGKDWLRAIVTETLKAQAGRDRARVRKIQVEVDRAKGNQEMARPDGERVIEIHTRHLRDLEKHARNLEVHEKELEAHAEAMSPEERARIHAELDRAKAEIDKARAEGRQVRMEVIERRGEVPGTIVIQKDGDPKNVVVKRFKVQKDGHPGEDHLVSIPDQDFEDVVIEGMDQDIHIPEIRIPRIHVQPFAHRGEENPQAEMAEIQAELRALQARLDQLQRQVASTPKTPRTPRTPVTPITPATPKSAHPSIPPPPPPPPPPAPEPPPPPPALAPPPAPPAPPAPPSR